MNWQKKLLQLKQEIKSGDGSEKEEPDNLAQSILQDISALRLLREMNQVLFDGKARIETFHNQNGYHTIIALLWEGSIRAPKFASLKTKTPNKIFIGIKNEKVYVNGKEVKPVTIENLQESILVHMQQIIKLEQKSIRK